MLVCGSVVAQDSPEATVPNEPAEGSEQDIEEDVKPPEGLWPSPKLLKAMLTRWVEESGEKYDLDPDQRKELRGKVVEQWENFLSDNRSDIQPLVNEFIEMRMELEPPPKDHVEEWAKRAYPLFEKGRDQIHQSHNAFRKVLRPEQWAQFELDALKMNAGMGIAEQKLKQWQQGEFEKDDFWEPLPAERRARREERRKRAADEEKATQAAEEAKDPIAVEVGRWEKCVAEFNERFHLDEGQRTTSASCLSELKQRALAHRDKYRTDIAELEHRIESFDGAEPTLTELKKQLTALYGPVDEMFKELQSRLDQLPTTEQKATASAAPQREPPPPPTDKPG